MLGRRQESSVRRKQRHLAQLIALCALAIIDDTAAVAELGAGRAYAALYDAETLARRSMVDGFRIARRAALRGKHVCDPASDYALQLADTYARECPNIEVRLALASCCRNICSWDALGDAANAWANAGVPPNTLLEIATRASWGLNLRELLERARVRHRCRVGIDSARVLWLRSRSRDARLVKYIDTKFTKENLAIVAT